MNIGVMRGTWAHMLMQNIRFDIELNLKLNLTLIQGVADGEVDAGFISSPHTFWFLKNNPEIIIIFK